MIPDWLGETSDFDRPDDFTPLFDSLWRVHCMGKYSSDPEPDQKPSPTPRFVTAPRPAAQPVQTVSQVLTAGGIQRAPEVIEIATAVRLEVAAAAVLLDKESGGGHNVWGHDGVATADTYVKGGAVTKANYQAYLTAVHAGRAGRQGCGPCQLTWSGYQDQADQLGGCWDWRNNCRVGFGVLVSNIKAHGMRNGFRAFNGSGPAAERYANDAMARLAVWRVRLLGASPDPSPQEDDELTDEERAMLTAVYQFVSGSATVVPQGTPWPGWPTWQGGSDEHLTATDYLRRNNVDQTQVLNGLDDLIKAFGSLQSEVASLRARLNP